MILFTIYQEPFYAALRKSSNAKPMILPDSSIIKAVGYADDTNIVVYSEESLVEVEKIVSDFGSATNSKVNKIEKSKIYSMGKWKLKRQWPLKWLKQD